MQQKLHSGQQARPVSRKLGNREIIAQFVIVFGEHDLKTGANQCSQKVIWYQQKNESASAKFRAKICDEKEPYSKCCREKLQRFELKQADGVAVTQFVMCQWLVLNVLNVTGFNSQSAACTEVSSKLSAGLNSFSKASDVKKCKTSLLSLCFTHSPLLSAPCIYNLIYGVIVRHLLRLNI